MSVPKRVVLIACAGMGALGTDAFMSIKGRDWMLKDYISKPLRQRSDKSKIDFVCSHSTHSFSPSRNISVEGVEQEEERKSWADLCVASGVVHILNGRKRYRERSPSPSSSHDTFNFKVFCEEEETEEVRFYTDQVGFTLRVKKSHLEGAENGLFIRTVSKNHFPNGVIPRGTVLGVYSGPTYDMWNYLKLKMTPFLNLSFSFENFYLLYLPGRYMRKKECCLWVGGGWLWW